MNSLNGIIFAAESVGVRLRLTRRVDLARDRMLADVRSHRDPNVVGMIETSTADLAKKMRRVLRRAFKPGTAGTLTVEQAVDALARCKRMGFTTHRPSDSEPKRVITKKVLTERRYVRDPAMSPAELAHQLDAYPNSRWVGYMKADVSMSSLIGGFSAVRNRSEAQTEAATLFRAYAERAQLGGAKAINYEKAKVDTSTGANTIAEDNEDARRLYEQGRQDLGEFCRLAEIVIVQGQTIGEAAETIGFGTGGTAREKAAKALKQAADILASTYRLTGQAKASGATTKWNDGSVAHIVREDPGR